MDYGLYLNFYEVQYLLNELKDVTAASARAILHKLSLIDESVRKRWAFHPLEEFLVQLTLSQLAFLDYFVTNHYKHDSFCKAIGKRVDVAYRCHFKAPSMDDMARINGGR